MASLWQTLSYPLPATSLNTAKYRAIMAIMAPAVNQALVGLGLCRHFPRAMVFAPVRYLGLGIPHIHTVQDIQRLKGMIEHSAENNFTGLLYRATLENLIIEVGIGEDVLSTPYTETGILATQSSIKKSWEFQSTYDLCLKHDIKLPTFHHNDTPIMKFWV